MTAREPDPVRAAADRVIQLVTAARRGGPDGLRAARMLDREAGRALLAAVVDCERRTRTDADIGRLLGVTGHAITQRFPVANRRRGRRRPPTTEGP